jgi:DNA polymerase-2
MLGGRCDGATTFADERGMLEAFIERVRALDPDIIIGWNIIDFDFLYLIKRIEKLGIEFDIGRERSRVRLASEASFIRASRAKVLGRKVLDVMHLMRDYFYKFDDYRLETAGQKIVGEGKVALDMPISQLYEQDPGRLARYNLQDAVLVYRIAEKERLIDVSMALSALTGMQLDRVKASIATLDSLYVREARRRGIVCPSVGTSPRKAVVGGYVAEPKPGLYSYVLLCDFRSLYPSIIATFNIDPLTFGKVGIAAPNGATFGTGPSILPDIIMGLLESRAEAKREGMQTRQFAIKIIMNSIFGVLGNPTCRFHNAQIANAITSFGRMIIQETSAQIRSMGYEVVYGDTDSVFVVSHAADRDEAVRTGRGIESAVNGFYDTYVREEYGRTSRLLLEFEEVFDTFLLPRQRHDERGAKKRYAGMVSGKLKIVGLEYVRRDWTPLAKKYQYTLLEKVFGGEDYRTFTREYVSSLKRGERDGDLVYRKRLRKSIAAYTKTTPPHVKAARMMDFGGKETASLVEYVMTKRGPMPLSAGLRIDYGHYIDKQIRPIADSVLTLVGTSFDEVMAASEQEKITSYMKKN